MSRARVIAADPERVWDLVSDPHNLPRWWPRTKRVESVESVEGTDGDDERPARWTTVLETERGSGVRADYRCDDLVPLTRFASTQQVEGTPFARILRSSRLEIDLRDAPTGTEVRLTSDEQLRGLARLGRTMLRGAAKRRLDEALDGIERALVGEPGKVA